MGTKVVNLLERRADELLRPYFGRNGNWFILSPRMLEKRADRERPYPEIDLLVRSGCKQVG